MDDERREHALTITVNDRTFTRVIVDPHYEKKHPDINDQTVLALLRLLDGSETEAVAEKDGFTYLARELSWQGKLYRPGTDLLRRRLSRRDQCISGEREEVMTKWPKRKDIEDVLKRLNANPDLYSKVIPADAPLAERLKRDICAELVVYQRESELNQRELAQKLEINEALVSKMLRYRFDEFTIDRLLSYLDKLGIKYEFRRVA